MLEIIIDIIKSVFAIPLLKRFFLTLLLPNVLVWGFKLNNLDHDRNFIWRSFVGPYWFIEKLILILLCISILVAILWPVVVAIFHFVVYIFSAKTKSEVDEYIFIKKNENTPSPPSRMRNVQEEWERDALRAENEKAMRRTLEEKERQEKSESHQQTNDVISTLSASETKKNALRDITGRGA